MKDGGAEAMSNADELLISQQRLADAWRRRLPMVLTKGDKAKIEEDEADAKTLRVHISTAGHTEYSFDFKVEYVDSREIKVTLIDVEKAGQTVDERSDIIQQLIQDYTRHLHECAQVLHDLTHA
jgi:hypothetical protein